MILEHRDIISIESWTMEVPRAFFTHWFWPKNHARMRLNECGGVDINVKQTCWGTKYQILIFWIMNVVLWWVYILGASCMGFWSLKSYIGGLHSNKIWTSLGLKMVYVIKIKKRPYLWEKFIICSLWCHC